MRRLYLSVILLLSVSACGTSEQKFNQVDKETNDVVGPACPDWTKNSFVNYDNNKSSNFGCANISNLGAMVEDPNDLIIGKSGEVGAARTVYGINTYKAGQPVATSEE